MKRRGFTLLEVMVVIGTVAVALPAVFLILYGILRQQAKVIALQEVKNQGDYALNFMKSRIRNEAVSIYNGDPDDAETDKICKTAGADPSEMFFKDNEGVWFRFATEESSEKFKLIYQTKNTSKTDLTNSKITVGGFDMSCDVTSNFTAPIVNINFTITYDFDTEDTDDDISLDYRAKVRLRNS